MNPDELAKRQWYWMDPQSGEKRGRSIIYVDKMQLTRGAFRYQFHTSRGSDLWLSEEQVINHVRKQR